jgi:hypothetical protein
MASPPTDGPDRVVQPVKPGRLVAHAAVDGISGGGDGPCGSRHRGFACASRPGRIYFASQHSRVEAERSPRNALFADTTDARAPGRDAGGRGAAVNDVLSEARPWLSFADRIEYTLVMPHWGPDIFRMGRVVCPRFPNAGSGRFWSGRLWSRSPRAFFWRSISVPAIATTIASDLCAAYFLYPPDFSIYIADPLQVAELSFFSLLVLATSQFIGGFADDERVRKRATPYKKA